MLTQLKSSLDQHPQANITCAAAGSIIGETGNIFAGEVETFLAGEAHARQGDDTKVESVDNKEVAGSGKVSLKERRVRKIAKRVMAVSVQFAFAFIRSLVDSERTSGYTDTVNVYSSDDNHRHCRTPALVRILIFSSLESRTYVLIPLIQCHINMKCCCQCS